MQVLVDLDRVETRPADYGPNKAAIADLVERASRLTAAEVWGLDSAVAWRWMPLAMPTRGSVTSARAQAMIAARAAGREAAALTAAHNAREAALSSPGARRAIRRWSWAESGLAGVVVGVLGAMFSASSGLAIVALLFGLLAVASGGLLMFVESGLVTRTRLAACVGAAAIALAVQDLVEPETFQTLRGPWASVVRD
jgi:hypothetical protein